MFRDHFVGVHQFFGAFSPNGAGRTEVPFFLRLSLGSDASKAPLAAGSSIELAAQ